MKYTKIMYGGAPVFRLTDLSVQELQTMAGKSIQKGNIVIDAFRPRNTTYVLLIKYLKNGGTYVQVNIRTEELFEFINRVFEKKNMIMGMKQTPSKVKL